MQRFRRRALSYSAGGVVGEAASIGMLNGRSIGAALTTFREMTDGRGGPLASVSIKAAAACLLPSRLISRVPVACRTDPAPKNNRDLNAP